MSANDLKPKQPKAVDQSAVVLAYSMGASITVIAEEHGVGKSRISQIITTYKKRYDIGGDKARRIEKRLGAVSHANKLTKAELTLLSSFNVLDSKKYSLAKLERMHRLQNNTLSPALKKAFLP